MPPSPLTQFFLEVDRHVSDTITETAREILDVFTPSRGAPRGFTRASGTPFSQLPAPRGTDAHRPPPPSLLNAGMQQSPFVHTQPPSPPTRRPLTSRSPQQTAEANGWSAANGGHAARRTTGRRQQRTDLPAGVRLAMDEASRRNDPTPYRDGDLELAMALSRREARRAPERRETTRNEALGTSLDDQEAINLATALAASEARPGTHRSVSASAANGELGEQEAVDIAMALSASEVRAGTHHAPLPSEVNGEHSEQEAMEMAIALSASEAFDGMHHAPSPLEVNGDLSEEEAMEMAMALSASEHHVSGSEPPHVPRSEAERLEAIEKRQSEAREQQAQLTAQQAELQKTDHELQLGMKQLDLATKHSENMKELSKGAL